jgi:hypothetical protein
MQMKVNPFLSKTRNLFYVHLAFVLYYLPIMSNFSGSQGRERMSNNRMEKTGDMLCHFLSIHSKQALFLLAISILVVKWLTRFS